tara:strand:- start:758 stop:1162 length:405 start_codon:yes stop_codon:yes gene_type:complete
MAADAHNAAKTNGRGGAPLACYANYFEVGHNAFEFLVDAGQIEPGTGDISFHSRLAIGPAHAKLFSQLLNQSIDQFEMENGTIPELLEHDPADLELTSPREFEQRAIDARRRYSRQASGPAAKNSDHPIAQEER